MADLAIVIGNGMFKSVGCTLAVMVAAGGFANHYEVVSISGGQTTSNNGPVQAYGGNHLSWSGTRSANVVTASGQVDIEFGWVRDPANPKDPPSTVIVSKVSYAGATAQSFVFPTVNAANGLEDTPVTDLQFVEGVWFASSQSKGQVYEVKPGDETIKVNLSPSAAASGDWVSQCAAEVSVQVLPLEVVLGGTTRLNGTDTILQGQRCSGVLQLQGVTDVPHYPEFSHGGDIVLADHSWDVPGNTFLDFDVTPPSGVVTLPTAAWWQQESPYWYWRGPAELGQGAGVAVLDVAVSALASCTDGSIGEVGGKATVKNYRPYYAMLASTGPVVWQSPPPWVGAVGAGTPGNGGSEDFGFQATSHVSTPSWFYQGEDTGWFVHAQLGRAFHMVNGLPVPNYWFDEWMHDDPYPYNAGRPANTTAPIFVWDSPQQEIGQTTIWYSINDSFRHEQLYKPPGGDSKYVPLAFINWKWEASDTVVFPQQPTGDVFVTLDGDTSVHPEWEDTHQ